MSQKDSHFLDFIPDSLPTEYYSSESNFSRKGKISFRETFSAVCMLASAGLRGGVRTHLSHFLMENPDVESIDISNFVRARYKIKSTAFESIFNEYVQYAYSKWDDDNYRQFDRNIVAVDGSLFTLPASEDIRTEFDLNSMKLTAKHGYYPKCLVTTFYDINRKIPVYRSITEHKGCERAEFLNGVETLPEKSIFVTDRGYYGYKVFFHIQQESSHDIICRVPSKRALNGITDFCKSGCDDEIITITPTDRVIMDSMLNGEDASKYQPIKMRAVRFPSTGDDEDYVLLTTLLDSEKFSIETFKELYWDRWQIELAYRDEKTYINADKFHTKFADGVKQELYASVLMMIVTRLGIYLEEKKNPRNSMPQFLNAVTMIASRLPRIVGLAGKELHDYINYLIKVIVSVRVTVEKYRKSYPRVSKQARNKWRSWGRSKAVKK